MMMRLLRVVVSPAAVLMLLIAAALLLSDASAFKASTHRYLHQVRQQQLNAASIGADFDVAALLRRLAVGGALSLSLLAPPVAPSSYLLPQLVPTATAAETPAETVDATSTSATSATSAVEKVPLYTKRSSDVTPYSDVTRGFRLLRPFGFNEFDGAGGGYAVKFASLFDVDENVVVGSAPSAAGKQSIADFGSLDSVAKKLLAKRGEGSKLVKMKARESAGVLFYEFEFENPVDESLPRPKKDKPSKIIELYELCVLRGKLWSVQATSNDKLFPGHEKTLRAAIASFYPQL